MKIRNNYLRLLMILVLVILFSNFSYTFSVLPSQFYGDVKIDGLYARMGTNISVYDADGVLCGQYMTQEFGEYIVSCKGDLVNTEEDEGAEDNEPLKFYVNDNLVNVEVVWKEAAFTKVNLLYVDVNNSVKQEVEKPSPKVNDEMILLILLFCVSIIFAISKMRIKEIGTGK